MNPLKILINGDPILRKKSLEITKKEIKTLLPFIEQMFYTMKKNKGLGLAAPQVGFEKRLIIIATDKTPLVLINPQIISYSKQKEIDEEGCLSVPNKFGLVERAKSIKIRALNEKGMKISLSAQGLFARVIQHEIDHLDGILFIDKITTNKKLVY